MSKRLSGFLDEERTLASMPSSGNPPGMMGPGNVSGVIPNMMMVPRCTIELEKCPGGMKIDCICDDSMGRGMVQNLCTGLWGGLVSCWMTLNGMTVCCCNLTMGFCTYEVTAKGVAVTCTSADEKCCEIIQACCDLLLGMAAGGCTFCLLVQSTPVCCGLVLPRKAQTGSATTKGQRGSPSPSVSPPARVELRCAVSEIREDGVDCLVEMHGVVVPVTFPPAALSPHQLRENMTFRWVLGEGDAVRPQDVTPLPPAALSDQAQAELLQKAEDALADPATDVWEDLNRQ
jgi:hypothetical protein